MLPGSRVQLTVCRGALRALAPPPGLCFSCSLFQDHSPIPPPTANADSRAPKLSTAPQEGPQHTDVLGWAEGPWNLGWADCGPPVDWSHAATSPRMQGAGQQPGEAWTAPPAPARTAGARPCAHSSARTDTGGGRLQPGSLQGARCAGEASQLLVRCSAATETVSSDAPLPTGAAAPRVPWALPRACSSCPCSIRLQGLPRGRARSRGSGVATALLASCAPTEGLAWQLGSLALTLSAPAPLPDWGLQAPRLPPSFPSGPGHNEQLPGAPASTLPPPAGWSRPSTSVAASHGGRAAPRPSQHALGPGVTAGRRSRSSGAPRQKPGRET